MPSNSFQVAASAEVGAVVAGALSGVIPTVGTSLDEVRLAARPAARALAIRRRTGARKAIMVARCGRAAKTAAARAASGSRQQVAQIGREHRGGRAGLRQESGPAVAAEDEHRAAVIDLVGAARVGFFVVV